MLFKFLKVNNGVIMMNNIFLKSDNHLENALLWFDIDFLEWGDFSLSL